MNTQQFGQLTHIAILATLLYAFILHRETFQSLTCSPFYLSKSYKSWPKSVVYPKTLAEVALQLLRVVLFDYLSSDVFLIDVIAGAEALDDFF